MPHLSPMYWSLLLILYTTITLTMLTLTTLYTPPLTPLTNSHSTPSNLQWQW